MEPILIYDTTLRDGTQGENITFSADEKLKIAKNGWMNGHPLHRRRLAGIQPRDMRFFDLAKAEKVQDGPHHGFRRHPQTGHAAGDDPNLKAI
jgi:2-isopropylmalate synthase